MTKIEKIKNNATYKQVLADSFGGVMYDARKQNSYDAQEMLALWDAMSEGEKSVAGGIMKGAIAFLKGE